MNRPTMPMGVEVAGVFAVALAVLAGMFVFAVGGGEYRALKRVDACVAAGGTLAECCARAGIAEHEVRR